MRRLDGLPLALELAAARLDVLPPEALLGRLDRRRPLLVGGARDLPDRLRTMRTAIGWSHDLLPPDQRRVFRRLAVFVGGFDPAAAAAVCDATDEDAFFPEIESLVDKSLVGRETASPGPRYAMLETVREFAQERLLASGEEPEARGALARWCLGLAEVATAARPRGSVGAAGSDRLDEGRDSRRSALAWLDRLEAEHANLRTTLAWLDASGDAVGFVRLAGALGWFWLYRSHRTEGRAWLDRAVDLARGAGLETLHVVRVLDGASVHALTHGDYEQAAALATAELDLSRTLGDPRGMAAAENLLGVVDRAEGRNDQAAAHLEAALALFRQLGDRDWIALAQLNLGTVAFLRGDLALADALLGEALADFRVLGDRYGMAAALSDLALVAAAAGDRGRAAALPTESLDRWREVGTTEGLVDWLARVAAFAADDRLPELAARLHGAAEATRERIGYAFERPERDRQTRSLDLVRPQLGGERFAAAWAAGRDGAFLDALGEAARFLAARPSEGSGAATGESPSVAGLTPRELEVLRLVAIGHSDRQIGEALFISHRTVMRHVEHILAKLEVDSRTAAATQAVRLGLV